MEMTYERPSAPAHSKPPMEGAVATERGWEHPKTGELLVSIRGLLNDKSEAPVVPPVSNPVSNPGEGDDGKKADDPVVSDPAVTTAVTTPAADTVVTPAAADKKDDGTEGVEAKLFEVVVSGAVATVTILAPNNHASTKWTVNGELILAKGNTVEMPVGSTFSTKSAKGEFSGKA